ncbi:hypothetical protein PIB30_006227 [Stylosanthes scabra]|uniref:C2H2-type domain-containing protein n=1 Tax=Stylosanthes scabra TaxID=79078 RepID=A0ABU6Z0Z4_9FABA|nr:hypothetical protein [Stylosanthes scabra]
MEQVEVPMEQEEQVVQTMMMKGKRTKRQRLPSPLRLAMAMPSSTSSTTSSFGFDIATSTTPTTTANDDEDLANCLILLAQGGRGPHNNRHNNNHNKKNESLFNVYDCKTCNRSFPSFQALGGHRASHKKPKILSNSTATEHNYHNDPTSTALTLQISNTTSLYGTAATATAAMETTTAATPNSCKTNNNNKVHECSICGAEFTSGQALGGHMRRHRGFLTTSSAATATATATTTTTTTSSSVSGANLNGIDHQETKNNILKLDLNLPAPEDDHHHHKRSFQSKEKVIVFSSAASLVDCHY